MLKEQHNYMFTILWLINTSNILAQRTRTWTTGPGLGVLALPSTSALCSQPTSYHLRQTEPNTWLECSCCRLEKHVPHSTQTGAELQAAVELWTPGMEEKSSWITGNFIWFQCHQINYFIEMVVCFFSYLYIQGMYFCNYLKSSG